MSPQLRNLVAGACPSSPAPLLPDNDRLLVDASETVVSDPTPSTPLTREDLQAILAHQLAKAVTKQ